MSQSYAEAGVSIEAGDDAVRRIGPHVARTRRPEVLSGIGGFGGLFALPTDRYREPVLVSTTDGVGTKAEIARHLGVFDTIGLDLVAMCVDDLVCCGAEPLFFLDYLAVGSLDPETVELLVAGIADGCEQAGCALVGGEMAEHPGVMDPDQFDLAGFAVGAVERSAILDGSAVTPGDVLIGLASPGLRSNGYSLARRVLFDVAGKTLTDLMFDAVDSPTVGEELLVPSVIYSPAVHAVLGEVPVHAVAHITGGGLVGNLPRVLGTSVDAVVDPTSWEAPAVFGEIQRLGSIPTAEMRAVFNLGIGMVVVVPADAASAALATLDGAGVQSRVIGELAPGSGAVRYSDD